MCSRGTMEISYYVRWLAFELRKSWKLTIIILAGFVALFFMFASSTSNEAIYKVVLDAGSTGRRVHVFHFKSPKFTLRNYQVTEADLELVAIPLFSKVGTGLSAFADNPKASRFGLETLMLRAKRVVPEYLWAQTEVILMATAGLRLLKPEEAEALLAEARSVLSNSGFKVGLVDTIDGKLEAKYMFMMTHFVANQDSKKTVAIVDLGGGSVQLAYKADPEFVDNLKPFVLNQVDNFLDRSKPSALYLHSWLGYGLVAFRLKALEAGEFNQPHPCVPAWTPPGTTYRYGDHEMPVIPSDGSEATLGACMDIIRKAVKTQENENQCVAITMETLGNSGTSQCGLTGSWLGPSEPKSISEWRVFSYIFDLAKTEGLVGAEQSEVSLTANDFLRASETHCTASSPPFVVGKTDQEWWKCLDLIYVFTLFTDGFRLDSNFPVKVTKHLSYKGEIEIEAAWPLGAAIAAIRNEL